MVINNNIKLFGNLLYDGTSNLTQQQKNVLKEIGGCEYNCQDYVDEVRKEYNKLYFLEMKNNGTNPLFNIIYNRCFYAPGLFNNPNNEKKYEVMKEVEIFGKKIEIYNMSDFYMNPSNKVVYSCLIIKKDIFLINIIDENILKNNIIFREKNIESNNDLKKCYRQEYTSNKKITIEFPEVVSINFYNDFIGYKIIIKNTNSYFNI